MKIIDSYKGCIGVKGSGLLAEEEKVPVADFQGRPEAQTPFGELVLGLLAEEAWSKDFSFYAAFRPEKESYLVIYGEWLPDKNGTRSVTIRENGIIPTVSAVGIELLKEYQRYHDSIYLVMQDLRGRRDHLGLAADMLGLGVAVGMMAAKVGHREFSEAKTAGDLWFLEDIRDGRLLCVRMSEIPEFKVYQVPGLTMKEVGIGRSFDSAARLTEMMTLLP